MYEKGLFPQALRLASTGRKVCDADNHESRLLQADLWTTTGGVQLESDLSADDGYVSLKKALDLRLSAAEDGLISKDHVQIANSYMNLGTASLGAKKINEAVERGKKSITIREKRPEAGIQMLSMSYHNVGLALLTLNRLEDAEENIEMSLNLARGSRGALTKEHTMYVGFPFHSKQFYLIIIQGNGGESYLLSRKHSPGAKQDQRSTRST